MATEATFTVPSSDFPLGTLFEQLSEATIELERLVPSNGAVIPYFWVRGVATDDITDGFDTHPGVKDIRLVDSVEDEYLLRVEWEPEYTGILTTLADTGVPLVSAVGMKDKWTFEIRGDSRSDVSEFQRLCLERDIPITLTALHALTPIESATEASLTESQQEALILAYRCGYFNSPRDVSMEELGEELDISQQAVSSRLRRGIRSILGRTLSAVEERSDE